jgi:hypothetical protein
MEEDVEGYVRRRLQFLLDEVKSSDWRRDNASVFCQRALSNYLTAGRDGDSATVKRANRWMSKDAFELATAVDSFKDWHNGTRNEHEDDLRTVWTWMTKNADTLTVEQLEERLRRPFVTVTLEEDSALRKLKKGSWDEEEHGHAARYRMAGILVGQADIAWVGNRKGLLKGDWVPR